jgi:CubicO group peptidase (beta-lactamase class C family)
MFCFHALTGPNHAILVLVLSVIIIILIYSSLFDDMTPVKNFKTSFLYSNMMYGFATYLSEKLDNGNSWENLMASEIFHPLGMTSSTVITTMADLSGAAQGYDKAPGEPGLVPVPLTFSK